MTLKELIKDIEVLFAEGDMETEVSGIASDTRHISAGDLFAALPGVRRDGTEFIPDAIEKGASSVMKEGGADGITRVPVICVRDAREALARAAGNFYGRPSEELTVVGVTGTNGKTTTTYLIKSILETLGNTVGLVGTISYMVGGKQYPAPYTTPEAPEFQGLLRRMKDAGCTHVVAEVSSHALEQKRAHGTRFAAGVFTNLTEEHLDYHIGMEDYFSAKRKLFEELVTGPSIINVDDPYGKRLYDRLQERAISFGIDEEADLMASDIHNSPLGLSFTISYMGTSYSIESPMSGIYNVYNILAAAGAAVVLGVHWDAIREGISALGGVKGRFEKVDCGQDFLCVVDFAHTGDALERLIRAARGVTSGRIITVFGCGGDRDRGKRPVMGRIAAELSDLAIVTSDNPRSEDPMAIINDVVKGIYTNNYRVVPDRAKAIEHAIAVAEPGDTVLLAGKGHEEYQIVGDEKLPFSDREAAERAIRARTGQGGGEG
jgi:UDP-N-acetylmuramoyl-L-alanyl-D-glutamate--2,6-diaminopimelate ligase